MDGMRRLADAWHQRVMADEVVAHAFSHGFHPQHIERHVVHQGWTQGDDHYREREHACRQPEQRRPPAARDITLVF